MKHHLALQYLVERMYMIIYTYMFFMTDSFWSFTQKSSCRDERDLLETRLTGAHTWAASQEDLALSPRDWATWMRFLCATVSLKEWETQNDPKQQTSATQVQTSLEHQFSKVGFQKVSMWIWVESVGSFPGSARQEPFGPRPGAEPKLPSHFWAPQFELHHAMHQSVGQCQASFFRVVEHVRTMSSPWINS